MNLNTSVHLTNVDADGSMRVQGNTGYIEIGPKNATYCHIDTDRGSFYMNQPLNMNGGSTVRGALTVTTDATVTGQLNCSHLRGDETTQYFGPSTSWEMYLNTSGLYPYLDGGSALGGTARYWNGVYSNNWFRSSGDTGWFNETCGGGMYMADSTWVKTWNSKGLYSNGAMGGILQASTSTSGYQYLMRNATYTGFIYYTSSREFKDSIVDVTPSDSGAWMDALQPVMFTERWLGEGVEPADEKGWREADVQVGFIAEDVLENDIISQFSQANSVDGELKAVGWKWECVIAASVAEIKSLRSRLAAADDLIKTLDERLKLLETE